MGVDYTAYAVIGLKVDPSELTKMTHTKIRNCDHDVDTSKKFCPECGRMMYTFDTETVFKYDGNYYDGNANVAGYKVVWGTDLTEAVIAMKHAQAPSYVSEKSFVPMSRGLQISRNNMKQALEPLGLWDENKFGLHAILHVSY